MSGICGSLFDMNHDGRMDGFERAAEYSFLEMMEREANGEAAEYSFLEMMEREANGEATELMNVGIDPEELEFMSGAERREILEGAGLNPDDYDF